jgi:hypothetical protein
VQLTRNGSSFVLMHAGDDPTLTIEALGTAADLARACQPRVFSNEDVVEAALFAAAEAVESEDDRDDFAEWDVVEPISAEELSVYRNLPLGASVVAIDQLVG